MSSLKKLQILNVFVTRFSCHFPISLLNAGRHERFSFTIDYQLLSCCLYQFFFLIFQVLVRHIDFSDYLQAAVESLKEKGFGGPAAFSVSKGSLSSDDAPVGIFLNNAQESVHLQNQIKGNKER